MRTPGIFIAYAPREGGIASAYFVLENFYTPLETRYLEIDAADLHTRWTGDEAMCHEPNWTFYSPEFERPVLKCLVKHWPLEYQRDDDVVVLTACSRFYPFVLPVRPARGFDMARKKSAGRGM